MLKFQHYYLISMNMWERIDFWECTKELSEIINTLKWFDEVLKWKNETQELNLDLETTKKKLRFRKNNDDSYSLFEWDKELLHISSKWKQYDTKSFLLEQSFANLLKINTWNTNWSLFELKYNKDFSILNDFLRKIFDKSKILIETKEKLNFGILKSWDKVSDINWNEAIVEEAWDGKKMLLS